MPLIWLFEICLLRTLLFIIPQNRPHSRRKRLRIIPCKLGLCFLEKEVFACHQTLWQLPSGRLENTWVSKNFSFVFKRSCLWQVGMSDPAESSVVVGLSDQAQVSINVGPSDPTQVSNLVFFVPTKFKCTLLTFFWNHSLDCNFKEPSPVKSCWAVRSCPVVGSCSIEPHDNQRGRSRLD